MYVLGFVPSPKQRKGHNTMHAGKKMPAEDTNSPAGHTDSADFTRSIIKTAVILFVVGMAASSCSPAYAQQAQAATETVAKTGRKEVNHGL